LPLRHGITAYLVVRAVAVDRTATAPIDAAVRSNEQACRLCPALLIVLAGFAQPAVDIAERRGWREIRAARKPGVTTIEQAGRAAEDHVVGRLVEAPETGISAVLVPTAAARTEQVASIVDVTAIRCLADWPSAAAL